MTTSLEILIKAKDEASATINGVKTSASGLSSEMSKTSSSMATTTKATGTMGEKFKSTAKMLGGLVGIVGIEQFASKSLEAFDLLQKSEDRLALGLKAIGEGKAHLDPLVGWAKSFSMQTGINEGAIVDMTSKLTAMGSSFFKAAGPNADKLIMNLTEGMTNLGAATGKSASMLMRSLGPAIVNTPLKAIAGLQKYGAISDQLASQIKALGVTSDDQLRGMVQAGLITSQYAAHVRSLTADQRKQSASTMEITSLQAKYAGEAAKIATPLEKIKNLWNQVELAGGRLISGALGWMLDNFPRLAAWFKGNSAAATILRGAFNTLVGTGKAVVAVFLSMTGFLSRHKDLMLALGIAVGIFSGIVLATYVPAMWAAATATIGATWPLIAIVAGIALVVLGVIELVKHWHGAWDAIKGVVEGAWKAIQAVFSPFVKFFVGILKAVWAVWKVAFTIIKLLIIVVAKVIMAIWKRIAPFFKALFKVIASIAKVYWNAVKAVITTVWRGIQAVWHAAAPFFKGIFSAVKSVAQGVWNGIKGVVTGVWHSIVSVWHGATGFFSGIWDGITAAAKSAFNGLVAAWNATIGAIAHGQTIGAGPLHVTMPDLRITPMALGGIVMSPTLALVGEAGPEAVIPLGRAGRRGLGAGNVEVRIDRRRWVEQSEFQTSYAGF